MPQRLTPKKLKAESVAYYYFKPFWTDCLNLCEPLPDTIRQYLTRFKKEDPLEFAARARHCDQINMISLIIEATISMLFSTNIDISAAKNQDKVDAFVNCCNMQGDPLIDFIREDLAPSALTYGLSDIVVDMPAEPNDKLSVEQAKARGLMPYCYIIPPLNRFNWSVDANGNYTEYRSEDILNEQIQSQLNLQNGADEDRQFNVWTMDTVEKYSKNGTLLESKPNPYGFIPIVTCAPVGKSIRYPNDRLGRSLVQDILPIQRRIINLMSLIWDFHQNANFPYRILKQDTTENEPPTEGELAEGGTSRGLIIRGVGSDYKIVSPDSAGVESMMCYLRTLIEFCYQQMSMPSDSNTNKTHQTGETIRSNQSVLFNKLTTYTRRMEKTVKEIVDMALRVQGIDPIESDVKVTWDTNFSYESFTNAQEQLSLVIQNLADKSPTAVAAFAKKVMSPQLFGSGAMEKAETELDKWAAKPIPDPMTAGDDPNNPDVKPKTTQQESTQIAAADKISQDAEGD